MELSNLADKRGRLGTHDNEDLHTAKMWHPSSKVNMKNRRKVRKAARVHAQQVQPLVRQPWWQGGNIKPSQEVVKRYHAAKAVLKGVRQGIDSLRRLYCWQFAKTSNQHKVLAWPAVFAVIVGLFAGVQGGVPMLSYPKEQGMPNRGFCNLPAVQVCYQNAAMAI